MPKVEPTLRRKLLAWLLGPLFILLVLDTLLTYSTSATFANQAYDRALQEVAREVFLHLRTDGDHVGFAMPAATEQVLLHDQDDRFFYRVSLPDGSLLAGDSAISPPAQAGSTPRFYDTELHGEPVRMAAAWMMLDTQHTVLVQVAETVNKRRHLARDILANTLLPQLLLIVFATAIIHYGVTRGLHPLQNLKRALSSRSHLDLSPIATDKAPGEVRPLVEEMNGLLERLGKTLDFQNRFIADAAHQLKTPVAGIKAQIELALRENDPAKKQHSMAQLYMSADRLSRLVGQLLALARNEPSAADNVRMQALDLNALALEATMEWVPEALKRDIDLGYESEEQPAIIDGDAHRLRELINNLIDNAVRYSRNHGRVTVKVTRGEQVQLSVSDDSPKIPIEERQRIFERFHRLLGTPTDGSGLGLAIVSEIAALHNARITLEEDLDGIGNTFTVFFPSSTSL